MTDCEAPSREYKESFLSSLCECTECYLSSQRWGLCRGLLLALISCPLTSDLPLWTTEAAGQAEINSINSDLKSDELQPEGNVDVLE